MFDPVFGVYVCVIKQEEEEGVGAAQNDTAEEKHPGSGSDDSDDDSSVRPPRAPVAVFFVAEYPLLVETNQNELTCFNCKSTAECFRIRCFSTSKMFAQIGMSLL